MQESTLRSRVILIRFSVLFCVLSMISCGFSGTYLGIKAWGYEWSDCTRPELYLRIGVYLGLTIDIFLGYLMIRRISGAWKYVMLALYCGASWLIAHQAHWATDAPAACTRCV